MQWTPQTAVQKGFTTDVIKRATPLPSSELRASLLGHSFETRTLYNTDDCLAQEQTTKGRSNDMDNEGNMAAVLWSTCDIVNGDHKLNVDSALFARTKAHILAHPLYEELLVAHAACLRVAVSSDYHQNIDACLAARENVARHYLLTAGSSDDASADEKHDLDSFMVSYILLLRSFEEQLRQHFDTYASEAINGCLEIERELFNLTGETFDEGQAAQAENKNQGGIRPESSSQRLGLDYFLPTNAETILLQHVQRELKRELKQNYASELKNVRHEIIRKRRAGKLPENTTTVLKDWWNAHSKWPYPTEQDKASLVEETGLQLKQINNWFINQRKRSWQTQSSFLSHSCEEATSDNHPLEASLSTRNADMQTFQEQQCMQDGSSGSAFQSLGGD